MFAPNHKQLKNWDGYSRNGQAIYDSLFEQEMAEADKFDPINKHVDADEIAACAETEQYFASKYPEQ